MSSSKRFKWFWLFFVLGRLASSGGEIGGIKIAQSFDWAILGENGRCERIRTSDPLHPMQMRYLAALHTDGVSSS
jgi:hypothetical protein